MNTRLVKMKKENVFLANVGDVNGRITRARAAALRVSAHLPPMGPKQQDRKMTLRPTSKRAALDENKSSALDKGGVQSKRKAVLQDVTNVCCENSYQGCFNATKIQYQGKHGKQIKRGQLNVLKATSSAAVEPRHLQANHKIKNVVKTVNEEPQSEDTSSKSMVKDIPSPLVTMKGFGMGDYLNWDQISQVPSQLCCPPKEATLIDRNVIDIDSDHKDPQLCSIYAGDIYSKLLVAELVQRPCSTFMETVQRDITQSMRGILVDWLVEVSEEYKLVPDTLYLTVYLIDWYLSQNYIQRNRLQLLGIACMLIASKYEEICAPRVEEFCFITDHTYTREEVVKMESHVLKCFGFNISAPTTKTFLRRFLRAAQASYKSPSYELEYLADYLAELTLLDYSFLNYLPSVVAASAVFLARWTLDQTSHPWNPTLVHYTSYKASDVKSTVFALQDLQLNTNGCPLNAIRIKYKQQKFKSVAALSSPKLLETLF